MFAWIYPILALIADLRGTKRLLIKSSNLPTSASASWMS